MRGAVLTEAAADVPGTPERRRGVAFPRKGSRSIVVDGVGYRWRVRHRPTYGQGNCETPLNIAVARDPGPGAVAVLRTPHAHPGNWFGSPAVAVTPAAVARGIRTALAAGWRPDQPGHPFVVHVDPVPGS